MALVSYHSLDGDFVDATGNVNGTNYGATWVIGKIKLCANFDGASSYAQFDDVFKAYLSFPFTYSFWIKAPANAIDSTFFEINGYSGIAFKRSSNAGKLIVTVGGTGNDLVCGGRIDTGVWTHVCVVIDGASSKVYLDGGNVTESCLIGPAADYGSAPMIIGRSSAGTGYTEMMLDELGIWNTALTVDEVTALYNNGTGTTYLKDDVLYFDGVTDKISGVVLDNTTHTVEAWIKPDLTKVGTKVLIGKSGVGESIATNVYRYEINGNNSCSLWLETGAGVDHSYSWTTTTNLMDGKWHHVAYVLTSGNMKQYIDGVLEKDLAVTNTDSTAPVYIGYDINSTSTLYKGLMQEFRIWSVARTQQEIVDNINERMSGNEVGLLSCYRLNDNAGNVAVDLVGNYNGTITGTILFEKFGRPIPISDIYESDITYSAKGTVSAKIEKSVIKNCLLLDGTNDYLAMNSVATALGTGPRTIEMMVNTTDTGGSGSVIWGFNDASTGNPLLTSVNGNTFAYYDGSWRNGKAVINDGSWHHVALTHDGKRLWTYVDGVLERTKFSNPNMANLTRFTIGGEWDSSTVCSDYLNAKVKGIRVWNVCRTIDQIQETMDIELNGDEEGLVAYYKLLEGEGTSFADSSVNGHTGTIVGATWATMTTNDYVFVPLTNPDTYTVPATGRVRLRFYPEVHCTVAGVAVDSEMVDFPETAPYTTHLIPNVSGSHTIDVTFRDLRQFTIEPVLTGSGIVSPSETVTCYEFETPEFTFTTASGWMVTKCGIDGATSKWFKSSYTLDPVIDDHTFNVVMEDPKEMGLVLSVETVYLEMSGTIFASSALEYCQNSNRCVPFVTQNSDSNAIYANFTNVYFQDNEVMASKYATASNSDLFVNVVDFNPERVRVTQGSFSFSTTTHTVSISEIDPNHTFMVFTYQSSSSSALWYYQHVRGRIVNSTSIEFFRAAANGTISGTYYIVEALDGGFKVQQILQSSGNAEPTIPEDVFIGRTFSVVSYAMSDGNDDSDRNTAYFGVFNGRSMLMSRNANYGTIYACIQLIEFTEKGKIFVYHHKYMSLGDSTSQITKLTPEVLTGINVMPHNPSNLQGVFRGTGTDSVHSRVFHTLELINENEFRVTRKGTGTTSHISLQFVDWDGVSLGASPVSAPINSDVVKSVEHIQTTLYSSMGQYVKHLPLSKGQVWNNCVPFCTYYSSSDAPFNTKCDIDISEGPIVTILRGEGHNVNCVVNIYVVEFKEEAAFVEKGHFYSTGTSCTCTVSGTTSSGVADLNRSFLQFTQCSRYGSTIWPYTDVGGYFSNESSLVFTRGLASNNIYGHYYVVEGKKDYFYTEQKQFTWAFAEGNNAADKVWPMNRTMPLCTYYTTDDSDYNDRHTILYDHQSPTFGYISKRSGYGTAYAKLQLIRLDVPQVTVQQVYASMDTSTVSGAITLQQPVNAETSMVLNSNQQSLGRTYGTYTGDISSAFMTAWLSDDGTQVFYRRHDSPQEGNWFLYVVDWGADTLYTGPYTNSGEAIASIEIMDIPTTDGYGRHGRKLLSKGQNPSQCVPFTLTTFATEGDISNMNYMTDIDGQLVALYNARGGERITPRVTVIEFDSRKARVYKYYFMLNSVTNVAITITPVVREKSFFVLTFTGDGGNLFYRQSVRILFTSDSTVEIRRGVADNRVWGVFYIVEAIDDAFLVDHVTGGGTTFAIDTPTLDRKYDLVLTSHYAVEDSDDSDRNTWSSFIDEYNRAFIQNYNGYGTGYFAVQLIKFKSGVVNKSGILYTSFGAGTTTRTYNLGSAYNPEVTLIAPVSANNSGRTSSTTGGQGRAGYGMAELTASGTQLTVSRGYGGVTSEPHFNIVEFNPPYQYYFEGTAMMGTSYLDRKVALFRRIDDLFIGSTTSSGEDGFRLKTPYGDEHYIACFDDDAGESYNALIYDRVVGKPLSEQ